MKNQAIKLWEIVEKFRKKMVLRSIEENKGWKVGFTDILKCTWGWKKYKSIVVKILKLVANQWSVVSANFVSFPRNFPNF